MFNYKKRLANEIELKFNRPVPQGKKTSHKFTNIQFTIKLIDKKGHIRAIINAEPTISTHLGKLDKIVINQKSMRKASSERTKRILNGNRLPFRPFSQYYPDYLRKDAWCVDIYCPISKFHFSSGEQLDIGGKITIASNYYITFEKEINKTIPIDEGFKKLVEEFV